MLKLKESLLDIVVILLPYIFQTKFKGKITTKTSTVHKSFSTTIIGNDLTLSLLRVSFLRNKNELFLLENASNLTYEFLQDNFNKRN